MSISLVLDSLFLAIRLVDFSKKMSDLGWEGTPEFMRVFAITGKAWKRHWRRVAKYNSTAIEAERLHIPEWVTAGGMR